MAWMVLPRPISSASKRAFGEGQVQHAFALIGKERHVGFVRRPFAALHFEFILAAQFLAFGGLARALPATAPVPARGAIPANRSPPVAAGLPRRPRARHSMQASVAVEPFPQGLGQAAVAVDQAQASRAAGSGSTSRRVEPFSAAALNRRLKRACKCSSTASTCLQVPRPLMRKSTQSQANCRWPTSRTSTE